MTPLAAGILFGALGGLLVSFLFLPSTKSPQLKRDKTMTPQPSNSPEHPPKKSLTDRWAFKLAMAGIAMGIFTSLNQGQTSIGFMIGFAIPFALIFGFIGLVVDFFKK